MFHLILFFIFPFALLSLQWVLYSKSVKFIKELELEFDIEKYLIYFTRAVFLYFLVAALVTLILRFDSGGSAIYKYVFFYPLIVWVISSFVISLFFIFRDLVLVLTKTFSRIINIQKDPKPKVDLVERRKFLKAGSLTSFGIVTLPLTTFSYAAIAAKSDPMIERVNIKLNSLQDSLNGLKIVQISDIHTNQFIGQKDVERVTELVNREEPDIVLITGDFVSNSPKYIPNCAAGLRNISAKYGVFGCLGNHDYYTNATEVRNQMEGIGINLLVNSSEKLEINGARLSIAGIDDLWVGKPDYSAALRDTDLSSLVILMSHNPDAFPSIARHDVGLTLSGHTHGGQIGLRLLGNHYSFVNLVTPYVMGEFSKGNSKLYVNRGIGTVGPPLRLNSPPEISVITLSNRDN
ncbi:metallophosphoesterase [Candidatus Marinimicrobia bacterium MT.SAG.3]|nr:metallophosphoesterase [Candidatus Marinimicrobia bacterium MT.SAG.3]